MSSKLSFRARALDPTKPMPIYLAEELPDLPEYSAINRAVPQMPSGMEKEEESEHHLQRAICTGLIIPTPEVLDTEYSFYDRNYPANYKMSRQLIHMQPLGLEQDIPDYDMDSADEVWVTSQTRRLDISPLKFEQMMDRLEKSSGQTVVTLNEAKALLKQDDEVSIAVYDYWLNKRLKMQHPLILSVRTENRVGGGGSSSASNPYLAFRRRTEKMQTRKNRKNDETSYEKMLKLRRDLSRALTLLELTKRREKTKREYLHLSIEVFEKRYQAKDFNGHMLSEYTANAAKTARPAFTPIFVNQYSHASTISTSGVSQPPTPQWSGNHHQFSATQYHSASGTSLPGTTIKREVVDAVSSTSGGRKEKRQYKKRKHKNQRDKPYPSPGIPVVEPVVSSDEDEPLAPSLLGTEQTEDEGIYQFRRSATSQYQKPLTKEYGNWPWTSKEENGFADPKYRFTLTSIRQQQRSNQNTRRRCIGFARRRVGRGGRIILDRTSTNMDDVWSNMDFTIYDTQTNQQQFQQNLPNTNNNNNFNNQIIGDVMTNSCNNNNSGGATIKSDGISEHSVVVDLVTNRKNSIDCVARTPTINANTINNKQDNSNNIKQQQQQLWNEIVIKSEQNHKTIIKTEKFDDFDVSLARLSYLSGSSNNNNNNNNVSINHHHHHNYQNTNNIESSTSSTAMLRYQEALLRIGDTTNDCNIKIEQNEPGVQQRMSTVTANNGDDSLMKTDEQLYSDFLNVIRRDWLHFRPKTPDDNKIDIDNDPTNYSECTPLQIEIQRLGEKPPSSMLLDTTTDDDNLFLTDPFSLDDIMDDGGGITTCGASNPDSSSSGIDITNISGDSLPELSLSLGETDDNEMLDNILQECQFDDLKSFNANTNFWNGLLEETAGLCDVIDDSTIIKKCSLDTTDEHQRPASLRKDRRTRKGGNVRVGCSTFSLSTLTKDDYFKKEDPPPTKQEQSSLDHDIKLPTTTSNDNDIIIPPEKIKIEPVMVEPLHTIQTMVSIPTTTTTPSTPTTTIIKSENLSVIKTEVVPQQQQQTQQHIHLQNLQQQHNYHHHLHNLPTTAVSNVTPTAITVPANISIPKSTIILQHHPTQQTQLPQQQQQQIHTIHHHQQQQPQLQIQQTTINQQQQHQHLQQSGNVENTLILHPATSSTAAQFRRHTNGPTDKAALQNILKQTSLVNRKFQIQQARVDTSTMVPAASITALESSDIKPTTTYLKMTSFPSEFNVVSSNNVAAINQASAAIAANHNYSLAPQQQHTTATVVSPHQPITLIGQSPQSHNKFIISASPASAGGSGEVTYTTSAAVLQEMQQQQQQQQAQQQHQQNKITIPASNIKVNLVPSTLSIQSSTIDGQKANILTTAQHQQLQQQQQHHHQQQQQIQQQQIQQQQTVRKTVNMLYDSDKNRILYTTNIKNNRGQPFFAQLNSTKLLNLLPITQHKNNAGVVSVGQSTATVQGIVTQAGLLSKGQTLQRISTVSSGGTAGVSGVVTNAQAISIRQQLQAQQQQQQHQHQQHHTPMIIDTIGGNSNIISSPAIAATVTTVGGGGGGVGGSSGGGINANNSNIVSTGINDNSITKLINDSGATVTSVNINTTNR